MYWLVTVLAIFIAFGYVFYMRAILAGNADLTERSLLAALADWMADNGTKSHRKMWLIYGISAIIELIYLCLALIKVDNITFRILTAGILVVEVFFILRMHQRIWWFFRGRIPLGGIFTWKIERLNALLLFTHAIIVLLYPLACWFSS